MLFLLIFFNSVEAQNNNKYFSLYLKGIKKNGDMLLIATLNLLTNKGNIRLLAPPAVTDEENVINDFKIIVRKRNKHTFFKVYSYRYNHPFISYDSITLQKGIIVSDTIAIKDYYTLEKGYYKIKIVRKIFDGVNESFIGSNWVYFRTNKRISL